MSSSDSPDDMSTNQSLEAIGKICKAITQGPCTCYPEIPHPPRRRYVLDGPFQGWPCEECGGLETRRDVRAVRALNRLWSLKREEDADADGEKA